MKWKLYNLFEKFSPNHLYEVLKLRQDIFVIEQKCIYDDIDGLDPDSEHLLLLEPDNSLVGYLRIVPPGVKFEEYSLGRIAVEKSYRGKGLGKDLVMKGVEIVSKAGAQSIKIEAQAHLGKFYADIGFKTISDVYEVDEIPHIQMIFTA